VNRGKATAAAIVRCASKRVTPRQRNDMWAVIMITTTVALVILLAYVLSAR